MMAGGPEVGGPEVGGPEVGRESPVGAEVEPVRILFVCLGNICRSPTAEGVMRALVREAGLEGAIELDSAGTGAWHVGSPPDERATQTAHARGIVLAGAARKVAPQDFQDFDLILAMDSSNLRDLQELAEGEQQRVEVRLLREFDPASVDRDPAHPLDVPDPYYGGPSGFEHVLDLVRAACVGLLDEVRDRLERAPECHPQAESPPGDAPPQHAESA
jgi:protein-tyrosine phosphatase